MAQFPNKDSLKSRLENIYKYLLCNISTIPCLIALVCSKIGNMYLYYIYYYIFSLLFPSSKSSINSKSSSSTFLLATLSLKNI